MSKNLVIVESPAKAKTIEKFLGKDFRVLSSQGHIRDIEAIGKNSMGIDFQNGYAPNYVIDKQKEHLVQALAVESRKADKVWLASDEDREGEAIAWHLQQVLDLQPEKTHRIVFHEITKTAIQEAIQNPRDIDYNLVNAQQARNGPYCRIRTLSCTLEKGYYRFECGSCSVSGSTIGSRA